MRTIDKSPPAPTGDVPKDIREIYQYLEYLREQINFILANINKRIS